jgi:hypothetical protein
MKLSKFAKLVLVAGCLITPLFCASQHCLAGSFIIADFFESPFGEPVGDLTFNSSDGYLYATGKSLLTFGSSVYKIDPQTGQYLEFFEHPHDPINQLKYVTSCNGNVFVDHYPLLFSYTIYKIYPAEDIWTTFIEPETQTRGGIVCDGSNLILAGEKYLYTISLSSTQEETNRDKLITTTSYEGMTWDGAYIWGLSSENTLHKLDNGIIVEEKPLPNRLLKCRGLAYDGEYFWTYEEGLLSPYRQNIVKLKPLPESCPLELIYGEDSPEVALLKHFRDAVLAKTDGGRHLIERYYEWSPLITERLMQGSEFRNMLKAAIDENLPLAKTALK